MPVQLPVPVLGSPPTLCFLPLVQLRRPRPSGKGKIARFASFFDRLHAINRSKRAQAVAQSYARGLKKVCKDVVLKRGIAVKG